MPKDQAGVQKARSLAIELKFDYSKFLISEFVNHVARDTHRTIQLFAWNMSPGLFGAWLKDVDNHIDYIFYDRAMPRLQQRQTILHEIGHILCGHKTVELSCRALNDMLTAKLVQSREVEVFHAAQLREHQKGSEDLEAEAFANRVQALIRQGGRPTGGGVMSKPLEEYLDSLGLK
jgi:hypothetical protein